MTIKHVSFDVWNTLIRANPVYAMERTNFLAHRFGLSVAEARQRYTEVKTYVDELAIATGRGLTTAECCSVLAFHLGVRQPALVDPAELQHEFARLFTKHRPTAIPEAEAAMKALQGRVTTSIGSNSNFVPGLLMREFLDTRFPRFSFHVFSDEVEVAKPKLDFFDRIWMLARRIGPQHKDEVLHVGDHAACDEAGGKAYGFKTLLITAPTDYLHLHELP